MRLRRCAAVCLQPFSSTLNNFANKNNVEYEQKHFHGVVLPQAQRAEKNGMIPVMCRITVNGKVSQFSSKQDVEEKM